MKGIEKFIFALFILAVFTGVLMVDDENKRQLETLQMLEERVSKVELRPCLNPIPDMRKRHEVGA